MKPIEHAGKYPDFIIAQAFLAKSFSGTSMANLNVATIERPTNLQSLTVPKTFPTLDEL
ncbi:MAG TPA: hypothetical protein VGO59_17995 [Verrucomicrobiae bacterium]